MPHHKFFLVLVCVLSASGQVLQPCKMRDRVCATRSAKAALPFLITETPTPEFEPSDPLHVDKIVGNLADLKYTFTDITITGLKNCDVENVDVDVDNSRMRLDVICTDVFLKGDYEISGRLFLLPVEGNGQFAIRGSKYVIEVNSEIKRVEGKDGNSHLKIKSFQLKVDPQIGIHYDFTNLFNGQKELADTVLKFMNESWKEVSEYTQDPVFYTVLKKLVTKINKYLKTIPFEDLFLQ